MPTSMPSAIPRDLTVFDQPWSPVDVATLLFVRQRGRLLCIRKKRGLGQGLINAPGGRLEAGESPREAAVREVQEELRITPLRPKWCGQHRFQFVDGYSLHTHVYLSRSYRGTPEETDEATPIWLQEDALPYDQMWADDVHWLPLLLVGVRFEGDYVFDGQQMLDFRIRELAPAEPDGDLSG